uniref:Uncharacterized protein n=1 Tax=Lutzomyia longipalpis TaxID=7200 RepID=A0A1B0CVZ8_LUTLO
MAILHSCCLWKSVRKGSYASVIYTLIYFSASCIVVAVFLHDERSYLKGEVERPRGESILEKEEISPTTVIFNILLLICASCGVISSILVIVGLRTNQRELLLPWIFIMLADIIVECAHFVYLVILQTLKFEPLTATLFTIDFFIMCLNIYCLLCVISQYQEFKEGRGIAETPKNVYGVSSHTKVFGMFHQRHQAHAPTVNDQTIDTSRAQLSVHIRIVRLYRKKHNSTDLSNIARTYSLGRIISMSSSVAPTEEFNVYFFRENYTNFQREGQKILRESLLINFISKRRYFFY